jgi:hypothetical protein
MIASRIAKTGFLPCFYEQGRRHRQMAAARIAVYGLFLGQS